MGDEGLQHPLPFEIPRRPGFIAIIIAIVIATRMVTIITTIVATTIQIITTIKNNSRSPGSRGQVILRRSWSASSMLGGHRARHVIGFVLLCFRRDMMCTVSAYIHIHTYTYMHMSFYMYMYIYIYVYVVLAARSTDSQGSYALSPCPPL